MLALTDYGNGRLIVIAGDQVAEVWQDRGDEITRVTTKQGNTHRIRETVVTVYAMLEPLSEQQVEDMQEV